ncbi:MAG: sulfatase-like hydrolase/transferase, partial [Desulfobacula sp.]|uniref:sulfatase-like hydrolase/transferase n=1 Tax=Desulfobacula sp. TaxID=2593537 RepID=UPI001ED59D22|nr:sulfatase-like hydrolase/transferase [Desulfobacula sp.]
MFLSIFFSVFFIFIYTLIFYLSASTPVAKATYMELFNIIPGIITVSTLTTIAFLPIGYLLRYIFSLLKINKFNYQRILVIFFLFFGFLLLIENWSYSIFKYGLKTNDLAAIKFLFIAIAVFLSFNFSSGLPAISRLLSKYNYFLIPCLFLVTIIFLISGVSGNRRTDWIKIIKSDILNKNFNIVIVSSDGVNAKDMSVYGNPRDTTPFMNSKVDEFMVFENAFTNNCHTTGSIISLLTGILPLQSRVVYPPDILKGSLTVKSLPNILGALGYYRSNWSVPHYADAGSQNMLGAFDMDNGEKSSPLDSIGNHIFISGVHGWFLNKTFTDLTGAAADAFFIKELDNPYSQVDENLTNENKASVTLNDQTRLEMVLKEISSAGNKPFFILTHFMDTHGPKFSPKNPKFSKNVNQDRNWHQDFYHDSILDFDHSFEQIYRQLEKEGKLDKTILLVISDHGMGYSNKNQIPLMIRFPDQTRSGRYGVNVQLIDIAPTMLTSLNIEVPDWMEGYNLKNPESIPEDRFIFSTAVTSAKQLKDGKGWVRGGKKNYSFVSSNTYTVIRCNTVMRSGFPLKFQRIETLKNI